MRKTILQCVLLWALICSPASAATFLGDRFEGSYRFPHLRNTTVDSGSAVVSPTAQFTFVTGRINPTVRISASNLLITFAGAGSYRSAEFNGILLKNLSQSNISGLYLDPTSTLRGFNQSRLSFTSDSMAFNFEGLSIQATDRISANVAFGAPAIPEPAAWMAMLIGFAAVGFAMRGRRQDHSRVRFNSRLNTMGSTVAQMP